MPGYLLEIHSSSFRDTLHFIRVRIFNPFSFHFFYKKIRQMVRNQPRRKHTASVVVLNDSGRIVRSVCLLYQNGKNSIKRKSWYGIYPTEMTSSTMKVAYETGSSKLLGHDQRWLLTWYSTSFKTFNITSDEVLPNMKEIKSNLMKNRTALHAMSYQPVHDEDDCEDAEHEILQSVCEVPTNSIIEGMKSSFLTKTKFKLSPGDDMEKHGMVYFVIRDDGKVEMTCRSGRQVFDVSKQTMNLRQT